MRGPHVILKEDFRRDATTTTVTAVCLNCNINLLYDDPSDPTGLCSHAQAIEINEIHDGPLVWRCPFCYHLWPAFKIDGMDADPILHELGRSLISMLEEGKVTI